MARESIAERMALDTLESIEIAREKASEPISCKDVELHHLILSENGDSYIGS